jgi:hypothetical protein
MAWNKQPNGTPHTCGGPVFGRLAPRGECKRCDELRFGLPARQWASAIAKRRCDAMRLEDIRKHDCVASRCGPICTFGDW